MDALLINAIESGDKLRQKRLVEFMLNCGHNKLESYPKELRQLYKECCNDKKMKNENRELYLEMTSAPEKSIYTLPQMNLGITRCRNYVLGRQCRGIWISGRCVYGHEHDYYYIRGRKKYYPTIY